MTGTDGAQPRTDSSRKEERRRGESAEHRQTDGLNNGCRGWIMVVTCPQSVLRHPLFSPSVCLCSALSPLLRSSFRDESVRGCAPSVPVIHLGRF
jgi:hypothetical protein